MRYEVKTAIAGVAAGVLVSGLMALGRRAGLLHKTIAEDAEDWLDRTLDTRRHVGQSGTTAVEQANHLVASAMFGSVYGTLRQTIPWVPPLVLGVLYGSALYAINIARIAPLIGLTQGEGRESMPVILGRLAIHLLFGIAVAGFTEIEREWDNE